MRFVRFETEQDIVTLDEITEPYVQYFFVDETGKRTGKWVGVLDSWFDDEYVVFRNIYSFQLNICESKANRARKWKTVSGAIRFIKYKYKDYL